MRRFGFSERPKTKIPPKIELHYQPHHYVNADGSPNLRVLFDIADGRVGRHIRDSAIRDLNEFGEEMPEAVREFSNKHFKSCERCRKRKEEIKELGKQSEAKPQELPY